MVDGHLYVNVHTTMFPAGEIRGQVSGLISPIDGDQETPPTGSSGAGVAMVSLDRNSTTLGYDILDDSGVDIADAIAGLDVLFGGAPTTCVDANDVNDDGAHDIADVISLLSTLFTAGPPPAAPYPGCGEDPIADGIDCVEYTSCP